MTSSPIPTEGGKHLPSVSAEERRLLSEADFMYDRDDWCVTHHDLAGVSEQTDLNFDYTGRIVDVGRLQALPNIYAVNLPISWTESGPEEWEVSVFTTREAAEAAYRAALAQATGGEDGR